MHVIKDNPDLLSTEIIEQAKRFPAGVFSDAMAGMGTMSYKIKPVAGGMKIVGTAITVNLKSGSNFMLHTAIALAGKGYVLVASGKGNQSVALIGDLMTRAAKKQAIEGFVIDGLVRDVADLRELKLPIFCTGAIPAGPDREGAGEINLPIACGGITVNPGDLIVGDDDGVVAVPRGKISEVLSAAKKKELAEEQRIQEIANNVIVPEWLKKKLQELNLAPQLTKDTAK